MNNTTLAEALLYSPEKIDPATAASAVEACLSALNNKGDLLQGRAKPLTVEQLEAIGQEIKEVAFLALMAFERAGRVH